jgi:pimeloyl-ACP methyl ester carboxylesterase
VCQPLVKSIQDKAEVNDSFLSIQRVKESIMCKFRYRPPLGESGPANSQRKLTEYSVCRPAGTAWIVVALFCSYVSAINHVRSEVVRIDSPTPGLKLALHHEFVPQQRRQQARIVLFAEGSAVPTSGNAGYKINGFSWMDDLAERGFDVWSLDYQGLGDSSRYPDTNSGPKGTASECAEQLATAARYILKERRADKLAVIGDSFGTLVAGVFATKAPELVNELVLFAPVTPATEPKPPDTSLIQQYDVVTPQDFAQLYSGWLPPGAWTGINGDFFVKDWGAKYLDTDPESRHRSPPGVMIPSGPDVEMERVRAGVFPYDPAKISVPTMIVLGEWDAIATEAGGKRLFDRLTTAPRKALFIIGHGTHLPQFEQVRFEAYAVVRAFLETSRH